MILKKELASLNSLNMNWLVFGQEDYLNMIG